MPKRAVAGTGLEVVFDGQKHLVTADRVQTLNLLLSTCEAALQRSRELDYRFDYFRPMH